MQTENQTLAWSVAKIVLGSGLLAVILWKAPLVEMFYLFAYICIVPALVLYLTGAVSKETLNLLFQGAGSFREKVQAYMDEMTTEATPVPCADEHAA